MRLVLSALLIALPQVSLAYSNFGHELICQVAYELSEPDTQQFVDNIIKRGDKVQLFNFAGYQQRNDLSEFAKGCTWPDVVRKTTHRETDQYHYMNVPKGVEFDHQRDCAGYDCVTQAIQRYAIDLSDSSVNATNRKEALFFLGHFIADLHQPLHVGNKEDKGGNTIRVFATQSDEKLTSLHWLWDKHVPEYAGLNRKTAKSYLLENIRNPESFKWRTTNPIEWARESHTAAQQYVYIWPDGKPVSSEQVINQAYYDRAKPVIRKRFQQAALRLALMLDLAANGQLNAESFK